MKAENRLFENLEKGRPSVGVIVPMVNTPELAEAAVAACRYPKTGIRGAAEERIQ